MVLIFYFSTRVAQEKLKGWPILLGIVYNIRKYHIKYFNFLENSVLYVIRLPQVCVTRLVTYIYFIKSNFFFFQKMN